MRAMWFLLLVGSCSTPGVPCESTATCGDLQACLDEVCRDVECRAASDCALESWCNPETYACEPGCSTSDDCLVGDRCDVTTNTCQPRSCTNTQLDCDLGDRCNTATGECEKDPAPHCKVCSDDEQCGPNGACLRLVANQPPHCAIDCSPEAFDPCPAGLQCSAQITRDGEPDGFRCVGLCGGL